MKRCMTWPSLVATLAALSVTAACGGSAAIGDECGESGVTDGECEEGGICGKRDDSSEALECLTICDADADCSSGLSCNGVSGSSTKGCRVK
jgi:hypothetical protein